MPPEPFVPPKNEYEDTGPVVHLEADEEILDPTPDLANAQDVERRKLTAKAQLQQNADFWNSVLRIPVGRRVMWEMLQSLHAFQTRFGTAGPAAFPNSEATWMFHGEQMAGIRLYHALMRYDLDGTNRMLIEHHPDFVKPKPPRKRKKPENG